MIGMISYLISFLGILFWMLRIAVCFCASMEMEFPVEPMNLYLELVVLFISIPCFALILKRNVIGAFIYFLTFTFYFGNDLYNNTIGGQMAAPLTVLMDFLGVFLPLLSLIDIGVNKDRFGKAEDRKTVWFYGNKDFDRELDERADKNNYRT